MTIRFQILDSGGHFGRRTPLIRRTLQAAIDHVTEVSDLSDVDLIVHPSDHGTDQFPIDAVTMGPHNIHISIERSSLSSEELESDLFRTVVHELHHALRWRHLRARWSVEEVVALEGLALIADHGAAGPQDSTDRPLSDPCAALTSLERTRAEPVGRHRRWLYSTEEAQPGGVARVHALGSLVIGAALQKLEQTPWSAASVDASTLIDAGIASLRNQPTDIEGTA